MLKIIYLLTLIICIFCYSSFTESDAPESLVQPYAVDAGSFDNILIIDVRNLCSWCGIPDLTVTVIDLPPFVIDFYPETVTVPYPIPKSDAGTAMFTFDVAPEISLKRTNGAVEEASGSLVFQISSSAPGDDSTKSIDLIVSPSHVLYVEDAYGIPGSVDNHVCIGLENELDVAGIELTLIYDSDDLEVANVVKTDRTNAMDIFWSEHEPGRVVLTIGGLGVSITPNEGAVAELTFNVPTATNGDSSFLVLSDVTLSDPMGWSIGFGLVSGAFLFGKKGDVNGDGAVDVIDALMAVNIILEIHLPTHYEIWAADCNEDEDVNIIDVVGIINVILGTGTCPPTSTSMKGISSQSYVEVSHPLVQTSRKISVPIDLKSSQPLAGVQLRVSYDATKLIPDEPDNTERSAHMALASNSQNGEVIILVYSTRGDIIHAGSGPILTLPFEVIRGTQGNAGLQFEEIILAGPGCNSIPVEVPYPVISLNVGLPVPTVYFSDQNYPNPFNLETIIKYQLPEESYVRLTIYNILGQEVRTLTNEYKEAGYYTVRWDAKDDAGLEVASGLYFYRMQAGAYAKTTKMLLLK